MYIFATCIDNSHPSNSMIFISILHAIDPIYQNSLQNKYYFDLKYYSILSK